VATFDSVEPVPSAGSGTLFINVLPDGLWWGSWQDVGFSDIEGSETEVRCWADAQPAKRKLIFDRGADQFVPYAGRSDT
jgi:hypothetical protein